VKSRIATNLDKGTRIDVGQTSIPNCETLLPDNANFRHPTFRHLSCPPVCRIRISAHSPPTV
jgi:hypothetical protein